MDTTNTTIDAQQACHSLVRETHPLATIEEKQESHTSQATAQDGTAAKRQRLGFQCDVCRSSYAEKRSLVRHRRTSAGCSGHGYDSTQHRCSYCSRTFTRDDIRKRHEKEKHLKLKRSATPVPPSGPDSIGRQHAAVQDLSYTYTQLPSRDSGDLGQPAEYATGPLDTVNHLGSNDEDCVKGTVSPTERYSLLEPVWRGGGPDSDQEADHDGNNRQEGVKDPVISTERSCTTGPVWSAGRSDASQGLDSDTSSSDHDPSASYRAQGSAVDILPTTASDDDSCKGSTSINSQAHDSAVDVQTASSWVKEGDTGASATPTTEPDALRPEDNDDDSISIRPAHSFGPTTVKLILPIRPLPIKALRKSGAARLPRDMAHNPLCPLCRKPFGSTVAEVRNHVGRHMTELESEHVCKECGDIGFVHLADLEHHQRCAANGNCGFHFEHLFQCTGHHPPDEFDELLGDKDRPALRDRLWQWEQSQLHAFKLQVDDPAILPPLATESDRWSIGAFRMRPRTQSFTTLASSLGFRSDPDCGAYQLNRGLHARDRLSDIVVSSIKRTVRKTAFPLSKEMADNYAKQTTLAAWRGELDVVRKLISNGADVNRLMSLDFGEPPPRTLNAVAASILGGDLDVLQYLLDHRGDANIAIFADRNGPDRSVSGMLHLAIKQGKLEAASALLAHGARPDGVKGETSSPILEAAKIGHDAVEMTRLLLEHGAQSNGADGDDASPLWRAVHHENYELARLLLDNGASPNGVDHDRSSPIWEAVRHRNMELVRLFLRHDASPDGLDRDESSLIVGAARRDDIVIMRMLLEHGASPHGWDGEHPSTLIEAVRQSSFSMAHMLLGHGLSPNGIDGDNSSPLSEAVRQDNFGMVQMLLKYGAIPDGTYGDKSSPLSEAVRQGNIELMQLLLEYHASPDGTPKDNGLPPISEAVHHNKVGMAQVLLEHGANASRAMADGTLFYKTVELGFVDMVQWLLKHGADANGKGGGCWPINAAAGSGTAEMVQLLLEHGADANGKGCWTMIAAARSGNAEMVRLLLEHGATVDPSNIVPLAFMAAKSGDEDLLRNLRVRSGANIDGHECDPRWYQKDRCGLSIVAAAAECDVEAVELLLSHGVGANASCVFHGTALVAAAEKGSTGVIRVLLSHGALTGGPRRSARRAALLCGKHEASTLLWDHGPDPNAYLSYPPQSALMRETSEAIEQALASGATAFHSTAFLQAVEHSARCADARVIRRLIEQGFDVNQELGCSGTVLHVLLSSPENYFYENQLLELVKQLLQAGSDLSIEGSGRDTIATVRQIAQSFPEAEAEGRGASAFRILQNLVLLDVRWRGARR